MFRKAAVLILLALTTACNRPVPGVGLDPEAPLEAALLPPQYGEVGFWVSHPAHVAVFEFAPTRGVALLFPSLAGERNYMVRPGSYNARSLSRFARLGYLDEGSYSYLSPRYLVLIASRAPLQLDGLIGNHLGLRARMAPAAYSSLTPFSPVRALTELVVPEQSNDDWTTALYVVWGGRGSRALQGYRAITCNGVIAYVPWNELAGCSAARAVPTAEDGKPPSDTTHRPKVTPRKRNEPVGDDRPRDRRRVPDAIERWTPERAAPKTESDMAVLRRATPGWARPGPDGTIEQYGFLEGGPKAIVAGPRQQAGNTYPGSGFRDRDRDSNIGDRGMGGTGSSDGSASGGSSGSSAPPPSMPDGPRRPPVAKPDGSSPP